MSVSLFSTNGKLGSMYKNHSVSGEQRASAYQQVQMSKPLQVRYLRFLLRHDKAQRNKNEQVMVSTFIKTTETKQSAAEAVNLFNPKARFKDKILPISDFGGQHYGHPLCYYTKSYLGESIYFTAKVMELDRVDKKMVDSIQKGLGTVASLPSFTAFLPYAAGISVGIKLFEELVNLFDKDDPIIGKHDLDLHFNLENTRKLQSGRIVCIHGVDEFETERYQLLPNNRLVESGNNGKEYDKTSYFVLQIDAKENKNFESFDYYLNAAELLQKTNRPGNPAELVDTVVRLFQSYSDIKALKEIDELMLDADKNEVKNKINALYKSMSPEIQALMKDTVKGVFANSRE